MLHPALLREISSPEIKVLYDATRNGMKMSLYEFRSRVINEIKRLRQSYQDTSNDRLASKLQSYGNRGGWAAAKVRDLARELYNNKSVPNEFFGDWRSIEFECVFKTQNDLDAFASAVRKLGHTKRVTIKDDGSLRSSPGPEGVDYNYTRTAEVVLSYKKGEEDIVRQVCGEFAGRAYVNKSCGTHVHFDMRHVKSARTVTMYGKRLARCVPALKQMLPQSRRENQYCSRNINSLRDGDGSRYAFVNLVAYKKHTTIEVRGHSGTLDAVKILNWIALCERIMVTRVRSKEPAESFATPRDLIKKFKIPAPLAAYINDRTAHFAANVAATN